MPEIIGLIATLFIVLLFIYLLRRKPTGDDNVFGLGLDLDWLQDRWMINTYSVFPICYSDLFIINGWYFIQFRRISFVEYCLLNERRHK